MKRRISSLILALCMIGYAYADDSLSIATVSFIQDEENDYEQIDQLEPLFKIEQEAHQDVLEIVNSSNVTWTTSEDVQRKLAEEHDRKALDYSILSNKFYENERIRIFNYTAYNAQQLRNSLLNPTVENSTANEFYISFGYGMEFKINNLNIIGYEYLSSFPYDRGQIIRFYWNRILRY